MNANELRIGNNVNIKVSNGTENITLTKGKITKIENDYLWVNGVRAEIKFIEPLAITEDLLLDFGFVKSNFDGDNAWLNLRYRYLNFASDESVNFEKVYLTVNKMDIICVYVHELQNLYFALTQTELAVI